MSLASAFGQSIFGSFEAILQTHVDGFQDGILTLSSAVKPVERCRKYTKCTWNHLKRPDSSHGLIPTGFWAYTPLPPKKQLSWKILELKMEIQLRIGDNGWSISFTDMKYFGGWNGEITGTNGWKNEWNVVKHSYRFLINSPILPQGVRSSTRSLTTRFNGRKSKVLEFPFPCHLSQQLPTWPQPVDVLARCRCILVPPVLVKPLELQQDLLDPHLKKILGKHSWMSHYLYVSWGGENIPKYCKKKVLENLSFGIFWTETPTKAASCNALRKASASKLDKAKSNFLD